MRTFLFAATALLFVGLYIRPSADMSLASSQDFVTVYGGSCDYCRSQDYCNINEACAPLPGHPGYFTKRVGTGITQKFCSSFVPNKPGKTFCESATPKDCLNGYTCTDPGCDETVQGNCGPPDTEGKTTECDFKNGKDCTT